MNASHTPPPRDLHGRPEIETLIDTFYQKVRTDEVLGFIFDRVAATDWSTHLPKMYAFWETVLFRTGGYTGSPLAVHAQLASLTAMGGPQFDRWLHLFHTAVDELFTGPNADHIKNCATDMASVIHKRINHIPDTRLDPARLTPEQRARYAAYRPTPSAQATA